MFPLKSGLVAVALLVGLTSSAPAQFYGRSAYGGYPGVGATSGYYTVNGGFGNYGLPGAYPGYGGHGLSGYGPGSNLGGYFSAPARVSPVPQTYNNLGGLMNTIRTQTGRGNSYGNRGYYGVSRGRGR